MSTPTRALAFLALTVLFVGAATSATACVAAEGETPSCPDLPLLDAATLRTEGGLSQAEQAALDEARAKRCITEAGHATSGDL